MSIGKKPKPSINARVLAMAFLVFLATYATLYTVAAYDLTRWGWAYSGTLGDATFLPFPTGPRGVLMDVIAKMSPIDEFIYLYLIKTDILIVICISLWILVALYFSKGILPLFRQEPTNLQPNISEA